jgi:hypothetical protein
VAQSADGRLLVVATSSGDAAALSLSPVALTPSVPAPTGHLRLIDSLFAVSAADPSGSSANAVPLTVTVVPSDAALAAVGGDASQLVIGYLDPTLGAWIGLPTSLDASGRLVAQAPQAVTLAVFRQAPTFWVVPNADLPLTADGSGDPAGATPAGVAVQIVATQGSAYEVQLGDGSFAWLDGTQVTDVPAPDALPPLPAPTPVDPASAPGDPTVPQVDAAGVLSNAAPEATDPTQPTDPTQATDATVAADLTPMEAN